MTVKTIEERLERLETKIEVLCAAVGRIRDNEQKHVWALILMLIGTLIPLVLKVLFCR